MIKVFCFTSYVTDYSKTIMSIITKMGWEIICREECETITKIEVYIPEEDMDVAKFIFGNRF